MATHPDAAIHHSMLLSDSFLKRETSSNSNSNDFDVLLTSIGFGRWQGPVILATALIAFQLPIHLIGSSFLSAPMSFHCFSSSSLMKENDSVIYNSRCLSMPLTTTVDKTKSSNITRQFTGLPSCPFIEYDQTHFKSTFFSDWHLVCEQTNLRPLFQMLYGVGGLFGSTISGHVGDKFGRKIAILVGCVGTIVAVLVLTFVQSFGLALAMRLVLGIMNLTMLLPAWNLALESTPSENRSLVGMLLGLPYSIGVIYLALLGYFIRTWQYLLLAGSAPVFLLLPITIFVNESASWLILQGRAKEASKVLEEAAQKNKAKIYTPIGTTVNKLVETYILSPGTHSGTTPGSNAFVSKLQEIFRYFRSPAMRNILLLTSVLWFLQSCLYLCLAINANNFTRTGPFLYVALTGVMDMSAVILTTPLATHFGRKIIIFTGMMAGAAFFLVVLVVPEEYFWINWILVMTGFLLIGGSCQVNFLYGPELFPTDIRARGFAFVNLIGNLGYVFAPFVTEILANYSWWAANVFFGCAGILGSLTVPFLPETRNKPLPETLQDVEERRKLSKRNDIDAEGTLKAETGDETTNDHL